MNFDLVPCCVKDCDRAAKTQVTMHQRTLYMCYNCALKVAEAAERRGVPINQEDDDE